MPKLQGDLEIKFEEIIEKASEEYQNKNYAKAIGLLTGAWNMLPNGKYEYDESFTVVWYVLQTALEKGDIEAMNQWVDKVFIADPGRGDTGEREMWAGRVAYKSDEKEKALNYFKIAHKKSKGRAYGSKDKVYKAFLNENEKGMQFKEEISHEISYKIDEYARKGNKFLDKGQPDKALEAWTDGLNLIPNPQNTYSESVWFLVSIGDIYFKN